MTSFFKSNKCIYVQPKASFPLPSSVRAGRGSMPTAAPPAWAKWPRRLVRPHPRPPCSARAGLRLAGATESTGLGVAAAGWLAQNRRHTSAPPPRGQCGVQAPVTGPLFPCRAAPRTETRFTSGKARGSVCVYGALIRVAPVMSVP